MVDGLALPQFGLKNVYKVRLARFFFLAMESVERKEICELALLPSLWGLADTVKLV